MRTHPDLHAGAFGRRPPAGLTINLLQQSEAFDSAAWTLTEATITANDALAPDGVSPTADRFVESGGGGAHLIQQTVTISAGTSYVLSVHIKDGSGSDRNVELSVDDGGGNGAFTGVFDATGAWLTDGGLAGGATFISKSIEAMASGWYRISIAFKLPTTTAISSLALYNGTTGGYVGDGVSNLLIFGAQLELGNQASTYRFTP